MNQHPTWLVPVLTGAILLVLAVAFTRILPQGREQANPASKAAPGPVIVVSRPAPTAISAIATPRSTGLSNLAFDGQRALAHAQAQCAIGPRPIGTEANRKTGDYISTELTRQGWQVEFQEFTYQDVPIRNVIGSRGKGPLRVFGAHYDTRKRADNDPVTANRDKPILGANDGASGVAVLLELARVWSKADLPGEVRLAFFDAEDNGNLDGWPFSVGASYMAEHLNLKPEYIIVVDMVGDADQQIYMERNSDFALQQRIWEIAADLGYQQFFIPSYKYAMTDDHTPFLQRGMRAVDLIDFDYPYWHTLQDTCDKLSAASLEHVGRVLEKLINDQ